MYSVGEGEPALLTQCHVSKQRSEEDIKKRHMRTVTDRMNELYLGAPGQPNSSLRGPNCRDETEWRARGVKGREEGLRESRVSAPALTTSFYTYQPSVGKG